MTPVDAENTCDTWMSQGVQLYATSSWSLVDGSLGGRKSNPSTCEHDVRLPVGRVEVVDARRVLSGVRPN
jgi:hypothetical protein